MKTLITTALAGAAIVSASPAMAQFAPTGQELRGHTVDVLFADGARNAVYFAPNGTATITGPSGVRSAGTWTVRANNLCLNVSGASECWAYARRFEAGETVTLRSSCDATSQWTARSVNAAPAPATPPVVQGERG